MELIKMPPEQTLHPVDLPINNLFLKSSFLKMTATKEKSYYISFYLNIELSYFAKFIPFKS